MSKKIKDKILVKKRKKLTIGNKKIKVINKWFTKLQVPERKQFVRSQEIPKWMWINKSDLST